MAMALMIPGAGRLSAQVPLSGTSGRRTPPASIRITPDNVRWGNYLHDLAGPRAVAGLAAGGMVDQFRGKNDIDFGSRLAERATEHLAEVSVRHGLAAAMHRSTDTHYHFCDCHGLGPRVAHALVESFTDERADGSRAFSVARVGGAYAGGMASLAWEPHRSAGDAAVGATLSLGVSALFNVARELTSLGRPASRESP
jgi:hypothetical protein